MLSLHSIRVWLVILASGAAAVDLHAARTGDEEARIQASGFALGATISKPSMSPGSPGPSLFPAVVLVGSSGPADRNETLFGIPIFGQLASALADSGFLVVRYDKRGTGQSGGRVESASLADFAEDLRSVIRFVSDRKDVDRKRIAVVGHGEGGAVAMLAAAKENRIAALVLAAASSVGGADLNVYQVTHAMERSNKTATEQQATIGLQKRIQAAVLSGSGWDNLSPEIRRQAETGWFESFLRYNPAKTISNVEQPILVLQGDLDPQVPPRNAERLAALAKARKKSTSDLVQVPGVNHLLVPAATGESDEYATLTNRDVSPRVTDAIAGWLRQTFSAIR